jgi:hypothetical protein
LVRGQPELVDERKVRIIEGSKGYTLTEKWLKSRIVFEDEDGNRVAIDKRDNWIKIQRSGNVDWHREPKK